MDLVSHTTVSIKQFLKENLILVDPADSGRCPLDQLLGLEPEVDLLLGGVNSVGAVTDVAADLKIKTKIE
jgi:hypothetical protein